MSRKGSWLLIPFTAGAYLYAIAPSLRTSWRKGFDGVYYAHRGRYDNNGEAPENSLRAFAIAVEHGYGIELDVQLTKDGKAVVFHDFEVNRMVRHSEGTPVSGMVDDFTLEELQQFHLLNSNERIPTFEEVLEVIGGAVPLIVELKMKTEDHSCQVCEIADAILSHYDGPYVVESFHPMAVRWYRTHRPSVIRGQLSDAFTRNREGRTPTLFASEHLLFDWYGRPDFIAYNSKFERNGSRRTVKHLFHGPSDAWTVQSQEELDALNGKFDLFIFEGFDPK